MFWSRSRASRADVPTERKKLAKFLYDLAVGKGPTFGYYGKNSLSELVRELRGYVDGMKYRAALNSGKNPSPELDPAANEVDALFAFRYGTNDPCSLLVQLSKSLKNNDKDAWQQATTALRTAINGLEIFKDHYAELKRPERRLESIKERRNAEQIKHLVSATRVAREVLEQVIFNGNNAMGVPNLRAISYRGQAEERER